MTIDLNKLDNDNIKYPKEWRSRELYSDANGSYYVEFNNVVIPEHIQLYLMKTYNNAFEYIIQPTQKVKLLHALLTKV